MANHYPPGYQPWGAFAPPYPGYAYPAYAPTQYQGVPPAPVQWGYPATRAPVPAPATGAPAPAPVPTTGAEAGAPAAPATRAEARSPTAPAPEAEAGAPAPPSVAARQAPMEQYGPEERSTEELPASQRPELGAELATRQLAPEQPQPATSPYVDIYDAPEELTVFADLPGCRKEDITIRCVDNQLVISADRPSEIEGEAQPLTSERVGHVERTVDLPSAVEVDEAEATFENGVCKIRLPKAESARTKTIGFE